MEKRLLLRMLVMCGMFLGLMGLAKESHALAIIGPDTVCIGTPVTYTVAPDTPGRTYTWVVDLHGNIDGPSITDSAKVVWVTSGNAVLQVTDQWGTTASLHIYVVPTPKPYITTNFTVACQSLPLDTVKSDTSQRAGGVQNHILDDQNGCVRVCDSTKVRYYANGDPGGTYSWTVTGGTIITNYGDSIDVFWPAAGTMGTVILTETVDGCTGIKQVCILVTQRPTASFAIAPSTTPAISPINICDSTTLNFTDLSTGDITSPIVSWYWDFGDGTTASTQNPSHEFVTPGSYTTYLVVKNACNCTDTYAVKITVNPKSGPQILCPSVVCFKDTATYSTPAGCGSYHWTVTGGTIVSGAGTPTIVVQWTGVGTTGYGYVSLTEPCSVCPGTTTIKVPVILPNGPITGPALACVGRVYEYSLPLWPGTQYMWGCIGNPSAILGLKTDYKVAVEFTTPGTYTLHAWYKSDVKLCGGNVDFTVTVMPQTVITGDDTACVGITRTYTLSPSASGSWSLIDPNGNLASTGTGSSFTTPVLSIPGAYTLYVTGSTFCDPDPYTINVQALPLAVTSITGPDTVCLNRPYTYTAGPDVPGTVYNWVATGGVVVPGSGSNTVTVTWTSGPTMTLSVFRSNVAAPNCAGPSISQTIHEDIISLNDSGDVLPCANSYRTYSCEYSRAETYDWVIIPNTAGSVMAGVHDSIMQVLWNNTSGPAKIVCIVHKCDSIKTDTMNVNIQPSPIMAVTGPSTVCPGDFVSFTATSGGGTYTWNFGDGTGTSMTAGPVSLLHSFPENTTTGNTTYVVSVTAAPGGTCPPIGTGTFNVSVKPGPVAFATPLGSTVYCTGTPINTLLEGTVTNNVTGVTFQWYNSSGPISGATSSNYPATATGSYYFVAIAGDGCKATSNVINIITESCGGGGGSCGGVVTCNATANCDNIFLTGGGSGINPQWTAAVTPPGGPLAPGTSATATYDEPGVYSFTFSEFFPGLNCTSFCTEVDSIGIVPRFHYNLRCAPGSRDSLYLSDNSVFLGGWVITSITWSASGFSGSGANTVAVLPAGATYTFTETVTGHDPSMNPFSCTTSHTVVFPAKPSAAFRDSIAPICEHIPIYFFPNSPGGVTTFNWNFGDVSGVLIENPQRNYTWTGPADPQQFNVILTVTDTIGCVADTAEPVSIWRNLLNGTLGNDTSVCASAAPVRVQYQPGPGSSAPNLYEWSNGINNATGFINVGASGTYWVTVLDPHQCQLTTLTKKVSIIQTPAAQISGQQTYCQGDVVQLAGYAGNDPSIHYLWLRNGSADGTTAYISDGGLSAGTYIYQLIVTATDPISGLSCSNVSAPDTVTVYALPAPPTIGGPLIVSCSAYHLQLIASGPGGAGNYTWSNGTYGSVDDIYVGGPYRLWFTDSHGCRSHSDTYVPLAPSTYFPYFPSGCYTFCKQQLPDSLYGPPGAQFFPWEWLLGTTVVEGGTGYMRPYGIAAPGNYSWFLNNGICSQQTPPMDVTVIDCSACQAQMSGQLTCIASPAGYQLALTFTSPVAGTMYSISTNLGPVLPFSGTTSTSGPVPLTLTFTTLTVPPPALVTVELLLTLPGGKKCYSTVTLKLPVCSWTPERELPEDSATAVSNVIQISTAMMVYPNPAVNNVTVAYEYGNGNYSNRTISIFDEMGRKMNAYIVKDNHGSWNFASGNWAPGVYIIRMEGDGQALQTQRLVVTH